eukprot:TRINITY_DN2243_c0_g1_i2.p1 TRINITY_DN2243_c0_g1~~TRINITY_DN2243_c0_g1_i2.p1  ORF type:complete len:200 (+),score=60.35 TRINITY_DN2243_c0_g1_i2:83-601(+)
MPPKFDPTQVQTVLVRAVGGEVGATSALAPKLGPLKLPPKKIGEDIAKNTKDWKGIRISVLLTVQNRQATISVVPTSTSLIMRALKEPPRDRKKVKNVVHNGNVSLDEIQEIAKQMRHKSYARHFAGTVKEMLGTCISIGCTVEGEDPREICRKIDNGEIELPEYDVEPEEK